MSVRSWLDDSGMIQSNVVGQHSDADRMSVSIGMLTYKSHRSQKQFFERLVVPHHAAEQQAVVLGHHEKRSRIPARRHGHAQFASGIVVVDLHAFKSHAAFEAFRIALNL